MKDLHKIRYKTNLSTAITTTAKLVVTPLTLYLPGAELHPFQSLQKQ